jgi:hypothetical protein
MRSCQCLQVVSLSVSCYCSSSLLLHHQADDAASSEHCFWSPFSVRTTNPPAFAACFCCNSRQSSSSELLTVPSEASLSGMFWVI